MSKKDIESLRNFLRTHIYEPKDYPLPPGVSSEDIQRWYVGLGELAESEELLKTINGLPRSTR